MEPLIKPLGFDWRIGVSLVSSFVAREVFVSSMGTIYSVGDQHSDPEQVSASLTDKLRADPLFSPLLAICIMVYYVLAMQCLSTIAVVKRETNGWTWPLFMIGYMTALAWGVTFLVYQVGPALRLGGTLMAVLEAELEAGRRRLSADADPTGWQEAMTRRKALDA